MEAILGYAIAIFTLNPANFMELGIMDNGSSDPVELQRILKYLFMATVRFYFLMNKANNSFHRASYCFREKPIWYKWDCQVWRDEHWEFRNLSLEEMLKDVHQEDADSDEVTNEEGDFELLVERDWLRQQMGLY